MVDDAPAGESDGTAGYKGVVADHRIEVLLSRSTARGSYGETISSRFCRSVILIPVESGRNRFAVQVIPGTGHRLLPQDETPSALLAFDPVLDPSSRSSARENEIRLVPTGRSSMLIVLPTARHMRLEDHGPVHRVGLRCRRRARSAAPRCRSWSRR